MDRPRRILFVNDYLTGGGAEVVLGQLMAGLSGQGCIVDIYSGADDISLGKTSPLSYIYSRKHRIDLENKLSEFSPDVIHFLNYYHLLSSSVLDAAADYKRKHPETAVVYTAHDYHLLSPSSGLTSFSTAGNIHREPPRRAGTNLFGLKLFLKRWDHRGIVHSNLKILQWIRGYIWMNKDWVFDGMITPGKFMQNCLANQYPDIPVVTIRNPYNQIDKAGNDSTMESTKLKLVFIGRLGQEKGLSEFLIAFPPDEWTSISLDIFGDGPDRETLEELCRQSVPQGAVTFKGRTPHEDILKVLPQYDALVLPSILYENAPLTIVEAAFSGLRLLCSEWGGVKETAEFCGGEYLINPEEPDSVKIGLNHLKKDIEAKIKIDRDMKKLRIAYSFSTFIQKHLEFYNTLLG